MRRLRFWLRLFFYPLFIFAIATVLATCWLVRNLAGVTTWFAARSSPELSLRFGTAELAGFRRIEFSEIELRPRRQEQKILSIAHAAVDYSFAGLWDHHLVRVEIENPQIVLEETEVASFSGSKTGSGLTTKGAKTEDAWSVDHFAIRGGKAALNLPAWPQVRCEFSGEFAGLELSPRATRSRKRQTLALKNIRIATRGAIPQNLVQANAATASFALADLAQQRVPALTISSPSIHLRPELVDLFAAQSTGTSKSANPASPGWQVGRLHIKSGEFFVEDFGATVPVTSAKFALDATDIGVGGTSESLHVAQLWDVRAAPLFDPLHPFLELNALTINFSNAGLARNEIAKLETTGLWIGFGRGLRSLGNSPAASSPSLTTTIPAAPWRVRDLGIESGYLAISNIGLGIPDLGFYVRTRLSDVALSGDARFASNQLQSIELSNISIHSPLDPFVPVLNFKTIFLRFSIAQLLRNEIEEVSLLNPQIFVGEDLFWYADALQKKSEPAALGEAPAATAPPWIVKNLGADFGEIIIANSGTSRATLPLTFSWRAQQVDFSNLSDLQLKLKLVVPEEDYTFPSYELDLLALSGLVEFGLPPDSHKDNLVHTLEVKNVRWKQFAAGKSFVSVTYDKKGIYGSLGAKAYGGYLNGGFSFLSQTDSPWSGWISGSQIDLRKVTDVLAPQSFRISGPADFKMEVNGLNHEIERLNGSYTMRKPGRLKVTKLDDLLGVLPPEWTELKRSLTRIGLETLRDFNYEAGNGSFWFANRTGNLKLALQGPTGSRKLEAIVHGPEESPNEQRKRPGDE